MALDVTKAGCIGLLGVLGTACSGADVNGVGPMYRAVDVDLTQTRQRIEGFGASSAWTTPDMTDAQADAFFSPETGLGLSLLRVQIRPDGTCAELATAKKAAARGVSVWAAPWSPPAAWKDNGSTRNGGKLLPEHRQDWANSLAAFAQSMATEGVPLVGLSAQNEPDYTASWETCRYEPEELTAFIRDYLGPAMAAGAPGVPIVAPETQNWTNLTRFADPLMTDPAAAAFIGPVAMHHYGGAPFDYRPARTAGKSIWETEVSDDDAPLDVGIDSALRVASGINENLVRGQVNAWHYWWLNPRTDTQTGNSALTQGGQMTRRAWAVANWSRFVRPGFLRVEATPQPRMYVWASAFFDPPTGRVVIVVGNDTVGLTQTFTIAGAAITELTPWVTSADAALAAQPPVAVVDGGFSYALPQKSVTTFVGVAAAAAAQ
jgi:glucuronoarabinoxylan endo-1,4-beta-xylanase